MSSVSRKFIVKITIFTFAVFVITAVLFSTLLRNYYLSAFPYQILLIATVTTIGHLWVISASSSNTMKFTTAFMGSTTLKLMVYLFFMLIYLWIDRSQVVPFVLTFMVLYLLFTIFEVTEVLRFIKK